MGLLNKGRTIFGLFLLLLSIPGQSKEIQKDYCVSLQGNGRAIYAHFGALAYLVEAHGIPQGVSGGSSATVSMFILESILENPALQNSETGQVDLKNPETIAKVSFLLKTIIGLGNYMDKGVPAVYLGHHQKLFSIANKLVASVKSGDVSQLDLEEIVAGASKEGDEDADAESSDGMFQLYQSYETIILDEENKKDAWIEWLKNYGPSLFNEDTLRFLVAGINKGGIEGPGVSWFLADMTEALSEDRIFQFRDMRDFLRPFPISFDGVAQIFGSIGDFYAGNSFMYSSGSRADKDAADRFDALFSACDATNIERWVGETFGNGGANSSKCSRVFDTMLKEHFGDPANPDQVGLEFSVPLNEQRRFASVGTNPDLTVLPVVAMLAGKGAEDLIALQKKYQGFATSGNSDGKSSAEEFAIEVAPQDLQYGYFAAQADRDELDDYFQSERLAYKAKKLNEGGVKGRQSRVLRFSGDVNWNRVLTSSPAEPTIATFSLFGEDEVDGGPYASLSGWGGLFDVFPLKALGCKETAYVTTRQVRDDGKMGFEFPLQITRTLLSSEVSLNEKSNYKKHIAEMYSLDPKDGKRSSHERNLEAADLVVCTSWNSDKVWGMDYNRRQTSFRDAYLKSDLIGRLKSGRVDRSPVATSDTESSGGESGDQGSGDSALIKRGLRLSVRQAISGGADPIGCRK